MWLKLELCGWIAHMIMEKNRTDVQTDRRPVRAVIYNSRSRPSGYILLLLLLLLQLLPLLLLAAAATPRSTSDWFIFAWIGNDDDSNNNTFWELEKEPSTTMVCLSVCLSVYMSVRGRCVTWRWMTCGEMYVRTYVRADPLIPLLLWPCFVWFMEGKKWIQFFFRIYVHNNNWDVLST